MTLEISWQTYLIVCPLVFLAGFIDSVAGGGGLISLPAYYLAGLPPVLAAGTNKCSACIGTMASATQYIRGKKVDWLCGLVAAVGAFPGSWLGTNVLQAIDPHHIRIMMICIIPVVAAVTLLRGNKPPVRRVPEKAYVPVSFAIGLGIGFYDGLVGPGTGTFLIILFTMLLGMEGVLASGTAKIVNLASNLSSLTNLFASGNVLLALALPAAAFALAGNWLGAGMTIKRGTGMIRVVMLIVLALLLAKMIYDVV